MIFQNIEQIRKHQWVGNHYHDASAFSAIEKFIRDESNTSEDRAEAAHLELVDGMGCDDPDYTQMSAEDYVNMVMAHFEENES